MKPLLNKKDFEKAEANVKSFLDGEGIAMQQALRVYRDEVDNYVDEFWDDAYLEIVDPLVLNVNPIFILEDDPTPTRNSQVLRASSLVLSSLKFIRSLRSGTLSPDMIKKSYLCMSQFHALFGSARVPVYNETDNSHVRDKIETCEDSCHIVVMCRGQPYYFDVVFPDGTIAITQREIIRNLNMILEDSKTLCDPAKNAVGTMTTEARPIWAVTRARLTALSKNNKDVIDVIDRALYVLCLDDSPTQNTHEIAANMLHGSYEIVDNKQIGSCINRWYDKLQLIVTASGNAGVNFEHSAMDGHTVLRFASDVFTDTVIRFAQTISGPRVQSFIGDHSKGSMAALQLARKPSTIVRKLEFDIEYRTYDDIGYAERRLSDMILQNEIRCLEFVGYGKQYIVQQNMSPDAYVQIAIMGAYFAMYGRLVNTYESVQTKSFLKGRTEAARSASMEALAYFESLARKEITGEKKVAKLRTAIAAHCKTTSAAAKGMGVDRHLFALRKLFQKQNPGNPLPAIFTDAAYTTLGLSVLSTSNCGNSSLRFFGFGPVVSDGFGVGYIIKDDAIHFCVSSRHRQTDRFIPFLNNYLCNVQDMILAMNPVWSPPLERSDSEDNMGYDFFGDGDASSQSPMRYVGKPLQIADRKSSIN